MFVVSWVHTAYDPAPHNHSKHDQCRTPHALIHCLVCLMMGIMMPEACWDRNLIINIGLVAPCWFISLHPTFHDARSQEPKIFSICYFFSASLHLSVSSFSIFSLYFVIQKLFYKYIYFFHIRIQMIHRTSYKFHFSFNLLWFRLLKYQLKIYVSDTQKNNISPPLRFIFSQQIY